MEKPKELVNKYSEKVFKEAFNKLKPISKASIVTTMLWWSRI